MRSSLLVIAAALLVGAAPAQKLLTPGDIVTAAPASAWKEIPADDLLVIDLAGGGRVVIQLAPAFAPVHVANIRALARSGYWNGATVYRVQDNYVAQWGLNESDKPWPAGVNPKPPAEYVRPLRGLSINRLATPTLMHRRQVSPTAGQSDTAPRRGGRRLPIAMAASAWAATLLPIPAAAASSMP